MSLIVFWGTFGGLIIAVGGMFFSIIKMNAASHVAIEDKLREELDNHKKDNTISHTELWKEINCTKTMVAVNDQLTKDNKCEIDRLRNKMNGG